MNRIGVTYDSKSPILGDYTAVVKKVGGVAMIQS